jgi:hypothetical protein
MPAKTAFPIQARIARILAFLAFLNYFLYSFDRSAVAEAVADKGYGINPARLVPQQHGHERTQRTQKWKCCLRVLCVLLRPFSCWKNAAFIGHECLIGGALPSRRHVSTRDHFDRL